ncbi:early growth response protein 1-like [Copidosoma floridanum]|uniref:early growth response protein 1-like n=1 Tax=Copidosoma floridanum TaxID=29053 RepID=UPI000C6FBF9A|nr:early growth response protein 1-like [Copidosoma floridanum]
MSFWQPKSIYMPSTSQLVNPQQAKFRCLNCGRQYMRLSCLKRHEKVECGQRPKLQCHICQNWFMYKHNLTAHLKQHVEEPTFACAFCPKKFYRRDKLITHEKRHAFT